MYMYSENKKKNNQNTKYDVKEKTSQFLGCVIHTR